MSRTATLAERAWPDLSTREGQARLTIGLLAVALAVIACVSLAVGPVTLSFGSIAAALLSSTDSTAQAEMVIWNIRMPRIVLAILAGASLATAGALLQGLFRNPLADPSLTGVSAGAMLGAIGIIVLGDSWLHFATAALKHLSLSASAFIGALTAMLCLYGIATRRGRTSVATMLLAGVALAALAAALAGLLLFASNDQQLRDFTFWNLGSLSGASWEKIVTISLPVLIALALSFRLATGLNMLALGEASAYYAGIPPQPIKRQCVVLIAILTGCAVAVSGTIGFIGIVVPHLLRLVHGANHKFILPASALLGAILMLAADMVARTAVAPAELPIGIVTASIGAPFFLWLLLSRRQFVDM